VLYLFPETSFLGKLRNLINVIYLECFERVERPLLCRDGRLPLSLSLSLSIVKMNTGYVV